MRRMFFAFLALAPTIDTAWAQDVGAVSDEFRKGHYLAVLDLTRGSNAASLE